MNENFGVGLGREGVSQRGQPLAQLTIVVDFPVENNRDIFVFIPRGLMPAGKIDDAQPSHPQRQPGSARIVGEKSFLVRTTMLKGRRHCADSHLGFGNAIGERSTANAAHALLALRCSRKHSEPLRAEIPNFPAEHEEPRERDYDTRLSAPTSFRYSDSISCAGSPQPSRELASWPPAASPACNPGSLSMRAIAREIASAVCATTKPATSASSGAIPQPSVTTTGVPAAAASAAVFPKFSFGDGNTKASASRYASHLATPNSGPQNTTRDATPSRSANCRSRALIPPSSGPTNRSRVSSFIAGAGSIAKASRRSSGLFFADKRPKNNTIFASAGMPRLSRNFPRAGSVAGTSTPLRRKKILSRGTPADASSCNSCSEVATRQRASRSIFL